MCIRDSPVGLAQLDLESLGVSFPLFFRDRTLKRVGLGGSRSVVARTCCILGLRLGKQAKTERHGARKYPNQPRTSRPRGEHRKAYLDRNYGRLILCLLDTTRQEEVAWREKISLPNTILKSLKNPHLAVERETNWALGGCRGGAPEFGKTSVATAAAI